MSTDATSQQKPAKTDRRVIRTRAAIHEAFLSLTSEMDYNKITITALAQCANIDRKTFYTHYASIDDLLEDVIKQRLTANLDAIDLSEFYSDPSLFTKDLLSAIEAALPLSLDERRSAANHVPANKILTHWTAVAKDSIMAQAGPLPTNTQQRIDVILDFYLGGIFNVYMRWLKQEDALPIDTVLDLLSESITNGLAGIMGIQVRGGRLA